MKRLPLNISTEEDLIHYVIDVVDFYTNKNLTKELVVAIEEDLSEEFKHWCEEDLFVSSVVSMSRLRKRIKEITQAYLQGVRQTDQLLGSSGELTDKL